MGRLHQLIDTRFSISDLNSTIRCEIMAGVTSFLSTCYILIVNPSILASAGMNPNTVFIATCIASALGCFLIGLMTNFPMVIAPGMALNTYFAYVLVQHQGYSWESALAIIFLATAIFYLISALKLCHFVFTSVPKMLHKAICAGIGFFIAFAAIKNSQLMTVIDKHDPSFFSIVNSPPILLFLISLILILVLNHFKVRSAIFIGIVITSMLSLLLGFTQFKGAFSVPPSFDPAIWKLDLGTAFNLANLKMSLAFLLIIIFDSTAGLIGIFQNIEKHQKIDIKRISKAYMAISGSNFSTSLLGTSALCPYIESLSGIHAGGKTGLTSIIVSLLFIAALFFFPLLSNIPESVSTAVLLFISFLMIKKLADLEFSDWSETIPGLIAILVIPFSSSIVDGIGAGFVSYLVIKLIFKKFSDINPTIIIVSLIYTLYFLIT